MKVCNFVKGEWITGSGTKKALYDAVTGEEVAEFTTDGLDYKGMVAYARSVGGANLRKFTIHERALMLKEMAKYLMANKKDFYKLSSHTGATKTDTWVDVDGGISTLFVTSSKARREMQNEKFYVDGNMEMLSKHGTFVGQHIYVPREGVAVHINAFNFPCWGMLEKLGPTFVAGMPAIIKPSPIGSYLAYSVFEAMIKSGIFPEGAIQFIAADVPGDLLDHLDSQDVISFTGSASTGKKIRSHPNIIEKSVHVNLETDSLNCSILGPDVTPEMDEFKYFIHEVANEMTVKAGQKCTAIRRAIVPEDKVDDVIDALKKRLSGVGIGKPDAHGVRMGSLASKDQQERLQRNIDKLKSTSEVVYEEKEPKYVDANVKKGAFCSPVLLYNKEPFKYDEPHEIEAFGPVSTVMPYKDLPQAISLANKGHGSLVGSIFTNDDDAAIEIAMGIAPYHGRLMIINRDSAKESTGHGSPLPHLTHGGPGRAGGGEEMGGIRGILHYMQRVALQGSPTTLARICNVYLKGAKQIETPIHPFRKYFDELQIGETHTTYRRTVTEADIVNFGCLSGDHFYAHFDDIAARDSLFKERVAHGYFVLSAAAGLFVDPAPGPVLANYGLEGLRFIEPVKIGDTIQAKLTVKRKTTKPKREDDQYATGVVAWDVEVLNQREETVAMYTILTLVKRKEESV